MEEKIILHLCNKEAEISRIETIVKNLSHEINGNGQPGLSKTVPQLAMVTEQLSKDVNDLAIAVSALVKFQTETEIKDKTIKELKDENIITKRDKQWLTGSVITALLTLIIILLGTNITNYANRKTNPVINHTITSDTLIHKH